MNTHDVAGATCIVHDFCFQNVLYKSGVDNLLVEDWSV